MDRQKRDGYLRNISGIGPGRFGDSDYVAARVSLLIDLASNVENYTVAYYSHSKDNGPIAKLTSCTNAFPFGLLACQQQARQANSGFYTVQNKLDDPENRFEQWQIINNTTWNVSDTLTIKNIASYSEVQNNLRAELFGTYWVIPTSFGPVPNTGSAAGSVVGFSNSDNPPGLNTSADQKNFTEELQLRGNSADSRLTWQTGAYYERSTPRNLTGAQSPFFLACTNSDALQCRDVLAPFVRRPSLGSVNYAVGSTSFRNVGLYAQATYSVLDNLQLTGGIRYTWDKTDAQARQVTYRFFTPNVPTGFCTLGATAGLPTTPVTSPDQCRSAATQKSNAPTWLIGLDYKPMDDLLIYAKYSRGYRQGAANYSAPAEFQTFGPEKVDSYEGGLKTSWRGTVPGTFNVSLFYNDFTSQQLAVGLISSRVSSTQVIVNGGKSRIKGAEVEASVSPFEGLTLDASYAYLDTELKSLATFPLPALFDSFQFSALPGGPLTYSPKNKLSVTGSYRLPLPESIGALSVSATYTYSDKYTVTTGAVGVLPSTELVNLNLNWNAIGGSPVDLSAFATNVTKERYYVSVNNQVTSGFTSQQTALPRMYGVRLRYRFGS